MQKRVDANQRDKEARYILGLICNQMNDTLSAKLWMTAATRIDSEYYDANLVLAKICYLQALATQAKAKGIEDRLKLAMLISRLLEFLKESAFYWETCAKLKPS